VSEEPVEGHLSYFGCEIVLIGRNFIWHCWLILRLTFGKHSTKSQKLRKDPSVTSADALSRCKSRETYLVEAVLHPLQTEIEGPSGSRVVPPGL
jgi:hypothetical protein